MLINLILSRSRFHFLDDENSKENTAARRKKKWRDKAKRKGRTIFVPAENILIRNKQAILRGRSHKNITARKQLYKCLDKLKNIYLGIVSFVSRLINKPYSNRFRDLRTNCKSKQKCKQYSKRGRDKSKVDKYNYVSVKKIRRIIIDNLLIMSNIEINPGPQAKAKAKIIDIVTFNCNGMNNKQKLKRIIRKANSIYLYKCLRPKI